MTTSPRPTRFTIVRFTGTDDPGLYVQETNEDGNFVQIMDLDGETVGLGTCEWEAVQALNGDDFFEALGDLYGVLWKTTEDVTGWPNEDTLWAIWDRCIRFQCRANLFDTYGYPKGRVNAEGYHLK